MNESINQSINEWMNWWINPSWMNELTNQWITKRATFQVGKSSQYADSFVLSSWNCTRAWWLRVCSTTFLLTWMCNPDSRGLSFARDAASSSPGCHSNLQDIPPSRFWLSGSWHELSWPEPSWVAGKRLTREVLTLCRAMSTATTASSTFKVHKL